MATYSPNNMHSFDTNNIFSTSRKLNPLRTQAGEVGQFTLEATVMWSSTIKTINEIVTSTKKDKILEQPGVYIVEKVENGKWLPIYVGQTIETFRKRWTNRLSVLRELKLFPFLRQHLDVNYRIRLGIVQKASTPASRTLHYRRIEWTLIREIEHYFKTTKGNRILTNVQQTDFVQAIGGPIKITNVYKKPDYLRPVIEIKANEKLELLNPLINKMNDYRPLKASPIFR